MVVGSVSFGLFARTGDGELDAIESAVLRYETLVPTRGYITGSLQLLSIHVAASLVYM